MLKRLKLLYQTYNFFHKKELTYNGALYKTLGIKKKYFSSVSSKDFEGMEDEANWLDEKDSREELPNHSLYQTLPPRFQQSLLNWSRDGYAVLPSYLSEEEVGKTNSIIDELVETKKANWQNGNKIMFALHQDIFLKNIGGSDQIMGILEMLMGRKLDIFQSINFLEGSNQRTHSDFVHMTTFPTNNIIAIWIALEDMTPENGPLHYYPGSHKLPHILNKDYNNEGNSFFIGNQTYGKYEDRIQEEIDKNELKKEVFLAKKGDVLIWHANLLHGGEPVIDSNSTRKSMVFHYYSQGVICYHEIKQRPTLKRS